MGLSARSALLGVVWFVLFFVLGCLLFFPVQPLVESQVALIEVRTGMTIKWSSADWSLLGSTLRQVTVSDAQGTTWLALDRLRLHPHGASVQAQGQATWGEMQALVTPSSLELSLSGYPLTGLPSLPMDNGRLGLKVTYEPATVRLHADIDVSGNVKLPVLTYDGPLKLDGLLEFQGHGGTMQMDVEGDRLRGRGKDLDVQAPTGQVRDMSATGPVDVMLNGKNLHLRLTLSASTFKAEMMR